MDKVARLSKEERSELFQATAVTMGMRTDVIEKDFWVCFMLKHLFHDCIYKDAFVLDYPIATFLFWHVDDDNVTWDTYFCNFLHEVMS